MPETRHCVALALMLLSACAGEEPGSGGGPGGGKADDLSQCGEDGRTCLEFTSYDVLFTNPVCDLYEYDKPVATAGGGTIASKPKNVYCKREDEVASGARPSSPQFRILEWISALGEGDEIFLAYLSFSHQKVSTALCEAVARGADVTFVLDQPTPRSDELKACGGTVLIRGHQGSIGFAHDKVIMVNPNGAGPGDPDGDHMRLSFSSGNMSSGAVLHHENWHFMEVGRESFFVEAHRCLMQALIEPDATNGKTKFRTSMNECRAAIEHEEEDDIKAFFIPVLEDSRAITRLLVEGVESARSVDVGVHRFGLRPLIDALAERLESDESFSVRLVADDDLYWLSPLVGAGAVVGSNLAFEADNVERLTEAGPDRFAVKYLETNHGLHLLHHNKFLIYKDMPGKPDAVICGAANLTGTGFDSNLENLYYVEIPVVVDAFNRQFARFWDGKKGSPDEDEPPRATAPADMPADNLTPP